VLGSAAKAARRSRAVCAVSAGETQKDRSFRRVGVGKWRHFLPGRGFLRVGVGFYAWAWGLYPVCAYFYAWAWGACRGRGLAFSVPARQHYTHPARQHGKQ